jgi:hypothetical protein
MVRSVSRYGMVTLAQFIRRRGCPPNRLVAIAKDSEPARELRRAEPATGPEVPPQAARALLGASAVPSPRCPVLGCSRPLRNRPRLALRIVEDQ